MKILDLFSGTGSVEKVCAELGYEVVSLDICSKFNKPTIQADIMEWDYRQFQPGHFDVIFAGVPCNAYSSLQRINKTPQKRHEDILESNKIVLKTLLIIKYLNPRVWFIENPDGGALKGQDFMKELPFYVVSYCRYGFPYRKNTRIWTNLKNFEAKRCRNDCDQRGDDGRHFNSIGNSKKNLGANQSRTFNLVEKYAYPPTLIKDLLLTLSGE